MGAGVHTGLTIELWTTCVPHGGQPLFGGGARDVSRLEEHGEDGRSLPTISVRAWKRVVRWPTSRWGRSN